MKELFDKMYINTSSSFYEKVFANLSNNQKMFIVTANPETFMKAEENVELKKMLLDKDTTVVPDGIGIVKAARILGYSVKERITGIDLTLKLLEYGSELKKTIYLFGAKQEVIDDMKRVLKDKYPNIKLVGAKNGYEKDKDKIFQDIIKKSPDIILVALGIPKQEEIIYKYFNQFKKGIFIGVGGSLDVKNKNKKRAPQVFIRLNLEWLYRILKEPSRLKRFYNSNVKFLFHIKKLK